MNKCEYNHKKDVPYCVLSEGAILVNIFFKAHWREWSWDVKFPLCLEVCSTLVCQHGDVSEALY